jgi:hypothetical protein
LPQVDVAREADFCPLSELLEGHKLWLGMVVSRHDGSILAQEIIEQPPTVNDLATLLANSMERPRTDDRRGRPSTFYLRDNLEWEELFPHLKQLKIEVVVTEDLPQWDAAVDPASCSWYGFWSDSQFREEARTKNCFTRELTHLR